MICIKGTFCKSAPVRCTTAAAFTLIELVGALAISSILFLAIGSSILLASKAIPDKSSPVLNSLLANQFINEMAAEIETAIYITEHNPTTLAFTVADRNGDGSNERIRYDWSGTPGDPLTMQYNDSSPILVLDNILDFNFSYDTVTQTESYAGKCIEDAGESLLKSYNDGDAASFNVLDITNAIGIGQYMLPDLPGNAIQWRPTRLRFPMRIDYFLLNLGGSTHLKFHAADANLKPTPLIYDNGQINHSHYTSSYSWYNHSFANFGVMNKDQGMCLSMLKVSGANSVEIAYDTNDGQGLLATIDGGSSWSYYSNYRFVCELFGKVIYPGPDQHISRSNITAVKIVAQINHAQAAPVTASIQTLNAPPLLSGYWEADFDNAPTTLDLNGDGTVDWKVRDGSAFNTATLINGVWVANNIRLDTQASHSFDKLTTVEVRMRSTGVNSSAVFQLNADRTGGQVAPLIVEVRKLSDGTQMLGLYSTWPVSGGTLIQIPNLPTDMIDVRLVVDPVLDTVNLRVNDVDRGTFGYTRQAISADTPANATITRWGTQAEFDYIRIRVND